MVIGGIAVALWANPRATIDLDFAILLESDNIDEFKSKLEKTSLKFIALHLLKLKKINIIRFSLCKSKHELITVDLLLVSEKFLKNALDRRIALSLSSQKLYVATAEDLILLKLISHRPQDKVDISNIISSNSKLDFRYLKKWAKYLEREELLKNFLKKSK